MSDVQVYCVSWLGQVSRACVRGLR